MRMNFKKILTFLCVIAVLTVIFGTIYAVAQQDLRQSANDPQIQLAEDGAAALAAGGVPASLMPADRHVIDVSQSLAPFIMVFDNGGKVLESSMKAGNTLPVPPAGVFDYVRAHGEDHVTWQTASGLRFAAVIVPFAAVAPAGGVISSGFVLAARSLREVENREANTELIAGSAWALCMIIISVGFAYAYLSKRPE